MDRLVWPLTDARLVPPPAADVAFEPKRRLASVDLPLPAWLPAAEQRELNRRAAALGIGPREYALQAVRFAMNLERGTTNA